MPTPLVMAPMRTSRPPISSATADSLGRVSGVMIALAASWPPSGLSWRRGMPARAAQDHRRGGERVLGERGSRHALGLGRPDAQVGIAGGLDTGRQGARAE